MSLKNDILKNSGLLLEAGEEDDENKMYEKNGCDDVHKGLKDKNWKLIERAIKYIKNFDNRKLLKDGIKNKDWKMIEQVCRNLDHK